MPNEFAHKDFGEKEQRNLIPTTATTKRLFERGFLSASDLKHTRNSPPIVEPCRTKSQDLRASIVSIRGILKGFTSLGGPKVAET
ncbi:unnamed protein product [Dovyalis caffra]|uniref:Uncharacterized protein n=1 Tax=Dovyalis caffra TaxID=77055 RepID=A0AAV1S027_9ROSI|nr:unnamed protein product [Dovyalis caffra]